MFKLFVSHVAEPPSYNEKYIEARWKIFELEDLIKQLKGEIQIVHDGANIIAHDGIHNEQKVKE